MTGPIADYLRELERLLRERRCDDPRIVDEAREHLVDAAEDGVRRGLARDDAERDAVDRFGPAALIAAQALPVRSRMMTRLAPAVERVAGHWRWVTAATAVAAMLAGAASYALLPTFYRSESMIVVIGQPRVPPFDLESRRAPQERAQAITATILSDARLDRIRKEFGLGTTSQVRRDISVEIAPPPGTGDSIGALKVGFQSPDPRLSQKVTERLASLFIIENFEDQANSGRAIGDQFRVTKPPSLPTDPRRPGVAKVTVSGAFGGLALSIVALFWRK
jgi:hypothetical protein